MRLIEDWDRLESKKEQSVARPGQAASEAAGLPLGAIASNTGTFAIAFAIWILFGPSLRFLAKDLNIPISLAGLVKSLPILVGSLMRIPAVLLSDRIGARHVSAMLLALGGTACWVLSLADSLTALLAGGAMMGLIGATFACGVQAVSI